MDKLYIPLNYSHNKMKPALLLIDCQNDFIKNKSDYSCEMLDSQCISRIKQLIDFCRQKQMPIIFTQHTIKPDKSNEEFGEPKEVRACIEGTEGWQIIHELGKKDEDKVVKKDKFDAFYNTDLHEKLQKLGVDTLIICGCYTNNCVRATAEGAHYRNFRLFMVSDCCACVSFVKDYENQQVNDFTLKELAERMYETQVMSFDELKKRF